MDTKLQFDFLVDRENNALTIHKEYAADHQLIWDAYTKAELLEKWWAPAPLTARTKRMNFSEGGSWVYAMVQPNGVECWGRMDYEVIQPVSYFMAWDAFCDKDGNLNTDLPRARWDVYFLSPDKNTVVKTVISYKSKEDLEAMLGMGMEEGFTAAMSNLDNLLRSPGL